MAASALMGSVSEADSKQKPPESSAWAEMTLPGDKPVSCSLVPLAGWLAPGWDLLLYTLVCADGIGCICALPDPNRESNQQNDVGAEYSPETIEWVVASARREGHDAILARTGLWHQAGILTRVENGVNGSPKQNERSDLMKVRVISFCRSD